MFDVTMQHLEEVYTYLGLDSYKVQQAITSTTDTLKTNITQSETATWILTGMDKIVLDVIKQVLQ